MGLAGVAGAAVLSLALNAVLYWRRPPAPPLSPVFATPAVVQQLQWMARERPNDPEWPARLGVAYFDQRHYLSAVDSLETALRLGAAEAEPRRALFLCYSSLERHDEAFAQLRRLAALFPDDLQVRLQFASEHARMDEPEQAIRDLDAIPCDPSGYPRLKDPGGRFVAAVRLADSYGRLGMWRRSLELAQRVIHDAGDRRPDHTADAVAARALLGLGRPAAATAEFRTALCDRPSDPDLLFGLAQSLIAQRNARNEPEIRRVLETVARDPSAPGQSRLQLALIYEQRRRWLEAADLFVRCHREGVMTVVSLRHAVDDYRKAGKGEAAIYCQGLLYESGGRYAQAIAAYRELTRIHSCCQSGYMHVARVQRENGDRKAALATLLTAARLAGPPPKVYSELASAYGAVRDLERARATWLEFARRDPANADLAYQNLGTLADSGGRLDDAEALYRKCIELQPDADLYRLQLARLLLQRRNDPRRLQEAIAHLERAVTLAREHPETCFQLGIAYRYAGRNQEAIWSLRHAIDLDPGDGKPYQPLGDLLVASGKRLEGEQCLALFKRYRQFYQAWETLKARVTRRPRDLAAQRRLAAFYDHAGAAFNAISAYARVLELDPADRRARTRILALYRQLGQTEADLKALSDLPGAPGPRGHPGAAPSARR
jgi:tetratricopeptide (TPR) repeat protein